MPAMNAWMNAPKLPGVYAYNFTYTTLYVYESRYIYVVGLSVSVHHNAHMFESNI